jgi:glucose-6-phosphate isomerase, archaeal
MKNVLYEKPIKIELIDNVLFVNENQHPKDTRTVAQLKGVLKDDIAVDRDVYYMYRNVYKKDDIRYDITVILPEALGSECAKTHGHYHPPSEDGTSYPEIYQILKGSAVFILQKRNSDGTVNVMIVDAKENDVVLMPPDYGHISINNGEGPLVMANLVYEKFESKYEDVKVNKGAAYYYTKDHELVQNPAYIVKKNSRISAKELCAMYKIDSKDILPEFLETPEKFAYLKKPGIL